MNKRNLIAAGVATVATFAVARLCERAIRNYRGVDDTTYYPTYTPAPAAPREETVPMGATVAELEAAYAENARRDAEAAAGATEAEVEEAYAENARRDAELAPTV